MTGRRSNSPFSPKITIEYSKQPNSDLQHFEKYAMTKILQQCNLVVWDECTMAHKKKSLEALDRTMKDPRSTPVDELNACLTFDRFRFFCFLLLPGEGSYKRKN